MCKLSSMSDAPERDKAESAAAAGAHTFDCCSGLPFEPTPSMIVAGCHVGWVRAFQGEFEGFEPEHEVSMRDHIRDLWIAMAKAFSMEA